MLFLFKSAPEVEKRIHSKLFRKIWRSRGTKEPAYITVIVQINIKAGMFETKHIQVLEMQQALFCGTRFI